MNNTFSSYADTKVNRHRAVLLGLCAGDSLGSTSEFQMPTSVGNLCVNGWPAKLVSNRMWKTGQPTDGMSLYLLFSPNRYRYDDQNTKIIQNVGTF
jgi:ADP-ribosylglycohydrolase